MKWCDKCGDERAEWTYNDVVYNSDIETTVHVCGACKREIEELKPLNLLMPSGGVMRQTEGLPVVSPIMQP